MDSGVAIIRKYVRDGFARLRNAVTENVNYEYDFHGPVRFVADPAHASKTKDERASIYAEAIAQAEGAAMKKMQSYIDAINETVALVRSELEALKTGAEFYEEVSEVVDKVVFRMRTGSSVYLKICEVRHVGNGRIDVWTPGYGIAEASKKEDVKRCVENCALEKVFPGYHQLMLELASMTRETKSGLYERAGDKIVVHWELNGGIKEYHPIANHGIIKSSVNRLLLATSAVYKEKKEAMEALLSLAREYDSAAEWNGNDRLFCREEIVAYVNDNTLTITGHITRTMPIPYAFASKDEAVARLRVVLDAMNENRLRVNLLYVAHEFHGTVFPKTSGIKWEGVSLYAGNVPLIHAFSADRLALNGLFFGGENKQFTAKEAESALRSALEKMAEQKQAEITIRKIFDAMAVEAKELGVSMYVAGSYPPELHFSDGSLVCIASAMNDSVVLCNGEQLKPLDFVNGVSKNVLQNAIAYKLTKLALRVRDAVYAYAQSTGCSNVRCCEVGCPKDNSIQVMAFGTLFCTIKLEGPLALLQWSTNSSFFSVDTHGALLEEHVHACLGYVETHETFHAAHRKTKALIHAASNGEIDDSEATNLYDVVFAVDHNGGDGNFATPRVEVVVYDGENAETWKLWEGDEPGNFASMLRDVVSKRMEEKRKAMGSVAGIPNGAEEPKKSVFSEIVDDGLDASRRTARKQFLKLIREPLIAKLAQGKDDEYRRFLAEFLATEFGEACMSASLSLVLSVTPTPNALDTTVKMLSRELRVNAMEKAADSAVDLVMGPVREAITALITGGAIASAAQEVAKQFPVPAQTIDAQVITPETVPVAK